jgi:membrane-associated HD superfamily phosphohydrolase
MQHFSLSLWLYSPLDFRRFSSFLILYTVDRTPWTRGSARRKAATYTQIEYFFFRRLLLLLRRYSTGWPLASSTTSLQCSLFLIFSFRPFTFIFFKSLSTSSNRLLLGILFLLLEYYLRFNILFSVVLSSILILCDLINRTISSRLSNVFISSLCPILHILFSIIGPYILRIIFLSKQTKYLHTLNARMYLL